MANPNPTPLTADARRRGGQNQKRGLGRATIVDKLLRAVSTSSDADVIADLLNSILTGKQGNDLKLRFAEKVFDAAIENASQAEIVRLRSHLKSKEQVLASVLRQVSKTEATSIYNDLEAKDSDIGDHNDTATQEESNQ
ncbi:hypothetical protein [Shewanella algae]|uniref:hypothetical protein n=1 Tax=Shewanella algae TaxID=38313 RepID=UPI001AAD711D|nr:hypothetical protein [Shewanella algae]MBO2699900.1 hypothetical protein [Shewanella algae]